ncbi:hypothetical protein HQ585_06705 [candidate division KSB1 bacterium]|nr:hypothetical protein [candidate division KSB1 bacterium]
MKYRWITIYFCIGMHQLFGGSILSSQGIGLPYDNPTIRSMGMGNVSLAVPSASRIDHTNPAGLSSINTTQLTIQSVFHNNQNEDPYNKSTSNYANFDGFHFAIPFGRGLYASFGIKPITRIDYKIAFIDQIESEVYTKSLEGSGGVNRFSVAAAWSPLNRISIGVRVSYMMGRIMEESRNRFKSGSDYISTHDRISAYANGINWTVGLIVRPYPSWTIGGIYSPTVQMDTQVDIYQIFNSSSLDEGSIQYPGTFGIGTSVVLFKNLLIGMDYQQIQWAQLQINESNVAHTQNSNRISFGIEKLAVSDPFANYLKRIPLRLGALFQPYYILDPEGNSISELLGTFGFGLPLFHNTSHIDFMFGIGKRGSLEKNGLEENLIRFGLSITGGEKWFVRNY